MRRHTICGLLAALSAVSLVSVASAAPITWDPTFNITSLGDVDLSGNVLVAANTGDAVTSPVVGGVTFAGTIEAGGNAAGTFYTGGGFSTGDADLDTVLNSHAWNFGSFTLDNLTPGAEYRLQIIAAGDNRSCCVTRTQAADDGMGNVSGDMVRSGVGSVIGTFIADGAMQTINIVAGIVNGSDPGMSGYVLSGPSLTISPGGPGIVAVQDEEIILPGGNFAPSGTAWQSTTLAAAYAAGKAIDGNFDNFTHTTNGDQNPTWQVTLPAEAGIESIVLYNRGGGCCWSRLRDVTVTVRDLADTEDRFVSVLLNPENVLGGPANISLDLVALTGGAVNGGIVRVTRTRDDDLSGTGGVGDADEASVLSLGEVEVFGPALNARPDLDLGTASTILQMDIDGASKTADAIIGVGQLTVTGTTLKMSVTGTPEIGDAFQLFQVDSFFDVFTEISIEGMPPGLGFDTSSLYDDGTVRVVPEPSSIVLLLLGIAAVATMRRRRR